MDFSDSPSEAAFRAKAMAWLEANAGDGVKGDTSFDVALLPGAKAWQAKKADAGFACITWPTAWGGADGSPMEQVIFDSEEARYGRNYGFFTIGLGMCVPTVMAFADDATKQRFVGPALRGEEIWCQLFSEPSAGSDVAAARTRAVRADDGSGDWIINGQKVWTSGAHYSDFGLLLVRTDPNVPKYKGLTMFWVDMKSPGIEVRPLHQASGEHDFNEVYFTGVRVPDSRRLGDIGKGWNVALVTLMNERLAVGGGRGPNWADVLEFAKKMPGVEGSGSAAADGAFRERLAEWYVAAEGLKFTRYRILTALGRGQTPGPESSIGKIVSARQMQDIGQAALDLLDTFGIIADPCNAQIEPFRYNWFLGTALRIAGGTDEILKNIIAERVLGLPGDVRVDRDVAFNDLPRGS
jgi:alkylation response protein AidB-like acyl-CoA dehydrogenase